MIDALRLPSGAVAMVMVSGAPDPRRVELRIELEAALASSGHTSLSSKALGADRSFVGESQRRDAAAAGAEYLFIASVDSSRASPTLVVEVWFLDDSSPELTRFECALEDWSSGSPRGDESFGETKLAASRVAVSRTPRWVLEQPSGWRPRLGAGLRARPVLRDAQSGKWIPFDQAYAVVAREDWQAIYDRRTRARIAMSSVGSLLFAGGATTMVVFAWRPTEDDPTGVLDPAAFALGMGTSLVGTGLIMAGLLLDPHPVSKEEFRAQVEGQFESREPLSFRLHAGPTGASAGLRASF